jgi:transposase
MYEITTEPHRKLVRLKLTGMLTPEQVTQLYKEEHEAIEKMGCRLGEHVCIVDLTSCPLQVQAVSEAFKSEIGSSAKARRLALYIGSALGRMQARRIARERDDVGLFELQEEAEAWLFQDEARQAA